MNKKHNLFKITAAVLCLAAVTFFALFESGADMPFLYKYINTFKKNIRNFADIAGIELSIETQLYLDNVSTPAPRATMMPADKQLALDAELADAAENSSGSEGLTAKASVKPQKGTVPIAFDAAENSRFDYTSSGIICVNETNYSSYNESGVQKWNEDIQVQKPYMEEKNGYILISSIGDKRICLYKGKKLLYSEKLDDNIFCASLNENGDVVAVTEKEYFKARVVVLNKNGKTIFAWDSGSYDILDAAISNDRNVALSMLNTDTGAACFVTCMDVNGKTKFKTDSFDDTLIFNLSYNGNKLKAIADNRCISFNSKGKILWDYGFDEKKLMRCAVSDNGYTALVFSTDIAGKITVLSPKGKETGNIELLSIPEWIDIGTDTVAYNSGRDAVICDFDGKNVYETDCDADIKQLHILPSKKVLCVYSSSIQIKKLSKVKKIKSDAVTAAPENSGE